MNDKKKGQKEIIRSYLIYSIFILVLLLVNIRDVCSYYVLLLTSLLIWPIYYILLYRGMKIYYKDSKNKYKINSNNIKETMSSHKRLKLYKKSISSTYLIIIFFIMFILALPIYPCDVEEEHWSVFRPDEQDISYKKDLHPTFVVLLNGFTWKTNIITIGIIIDGGVIERHDANPIIAIAILGVIMLFVVFVIIFKKDFENKFKNKIKAIFYLYFGNFFAVVALFTYYYHTVGFYIPYPVSIKNLYVLFLVYTLIIPIYSHASIYCFIKYSLLNKPIPE